MKTHVEIYREIESGVQYATKEGDWTTDSQYAAKFATVEEAQAFVDGHGLDGFQFDGGF